MKVNEALADALAIEAAGPIFGLMGDTNMPVWGALCKDSRTRMVWSRDDGAAILMADGYSKATGKLGVVTVTCGPGLANGANAILTAARAGTPLVVFTGEYTDDGGKGGLQALDQRQFAQACEAEFRPLASLDSLAEDIAEGFFTARTRQCPVILNMPAALWEAELPRDWDYRASSAFIPSQSHAPPEEALAEVVAALAVAKRPVLVAGRNAILADAKGDIERLGDRIGALLATSLVAKGLFDGHPWHAAHRRELGAAGVAAGDGSAAFTGVRLRHAGAEAEGAVGHRASEQRRHGVDLGPRRRPLERRLAHHVVAQRRVREQAGDVDAEAARVEHVEVLAPGLPAPVDALPHDVDRDAFDADQVLHDAFAHLGAHRRDADAAVAEHDRRHAVQRRACRQRVPGKLRVVVGVRVDEARREDPAFGVDAAPRRRAAEATHGDDATVFDRQRAQHAGCAGAVAQPRVVEDEVVHGAPDGGSVLLVDKQVSMLACSRDKATQRRRS